MGSRGNSRWMAYEMMRGTNTDATAVINRKRYACQTFLGKSARHAGEHPVTGHLTEDKSGE